MTLLRRLCVCASAFLIGVIVSVSAEAQSGQISGRVVDAQGGPIATATLTLTGPPAVPLVQNARADGEFSFTGLVPGSYKLVITAPDFASVAKEQKIGDAPVQLTVMLDIASVGSRVTVSGGYQQTETSSLRILGDLPLLEVPFSVSNYDQRIIGDQQARTPLDVLKNDASVFVTNTSLSLADTFSVRGFSLNNLANFRQDGGFLVNLSNIPLEAYERVEVLRGLTGFLYGFTAPGGIVNYVTKRPPTRRYFKVNTGYSNATTGYLSADAGGQLGSSGRFGYRVNGVVERGGLPVTNASANRFLGAAALDWRITHSIILDGDYYFQERSPRGLQDAILPGANVPVPSAPDASRLFGQNWETYNTRDHNFGTRLHKNASRIWGFEVQARSSDFHRAINALTATVTNINGNFTGAYSGDDKQRYVAATVDAVLTAKFRTRWFRHEVNGGWMGVYQEQYRGDFATSAVPVNNLFNPLQVARPNVATSLRGFRYESLNQKQESWFVSDQVSLGSHWSGLVGVRGQYYRQDSFNFAGTTTAIYNKFVATPSFALIYKPVSILSVYGSYSRGLEQGGTAPVSAANAGTTLGPLQSRQVEFGAKLQLSRGISVTSAYFQINKGLEFVDPASNLLVQNGEQRHRGFETSVGGAVTRRVSVVGGITFIEAQAVNTGNAATSGRRPVNVPHVLFSIFTDYKLVERYDLSISGAVRSVSNFAFDATNARLVPGYTIVDLGLRWAPKLFEKTTVFRLNSNNIADRDYWIAAPGALYIGMPRAFRASVERSF